MDTETKFYREFLTDNEFDKLKIYFPCIFEKIMPIIQFNQREQFNLASYDIEFFKVYISYLGSITYPLIKDTIFTTLTKFENSIRSLSDPVEGIYFRFTNGYLLEKDFDEYEFCSNISDAVEYFNLKLSQLHYDKDVDYLEFRKSMIKLLNIVIKTYDNADEEMSSYQYAEIAYLKALLKELKNNNIVEIVDQFASIN